MLNYKHLIKLYLFNLALDQVLVHVNNLLIINVICIKKPSISNCSILAYESCKWTTILSLDNMSQFENNNGNCNPQSTVLVSQPAAPNVTVIQTGAPPRPANYLALAIVTTICCNLIFGEFGSLIAY